MWRYFTEEEMACPHCGACHMDEVFMGRLDFIRGEAGFPFTISSAYRCPEYNNQISSTGLSGPHTTGRAVDLWLYGDRALEALSLALRHGFTGIGVNQKGPYSERFIHLDTLGEGYPRPTIWTY